MTPDRRTLRAAQALPEGDSARAPAPVDGDGGDESVADEGTNDSGATPGTGRALLATGDGAGESARAHGGVGDAGFAGSVDAKDARTVATVSAVSARSRAASSSSSARSLVRRKLNGEASTALPLLPLPRMRSGDACVRGPTRALRLRICGLNVHCAISAASRRARSSSPRAWLARLLVSSAASRSSRVRVSTRRSDPDRLAVAPDPSGEARTLR